MIHVFLKLFAKYSNNSKSRLHAEGTLIKSKLILLLIMLFADFFSQTDVAYFTLFFLQYLNKS